MACRDMIPGMKSFRRGLGSLLRLNHLQTCCLPSCEAQKNEASGPMPRCLGSTALSDCHFTSSPRRGRWKRHQASFLGPWTLHPHGHVFSRLESHSLLFLNFASLSLQQVSCPEALPQTGRKGEGKFGEKYRAGATLQLRLIRNARLIRSSIL